MEMRFVKLACVLAASGMLTACNSMNDFFNGLSSSPSSTSSSAMQGQQRRTDLGDQPASMTGRPTNQSTAVGGKFESTMDRIDRSKLSRALDSGLGKATTWTNGSSGITFTVVPTRKVRIGNNAFCRTYNITAVRGSSTDQYSGTACLGDDSNWHPV